MSPSAKNITNALNFLTPIIISSEKCEELEKYMFCNSSRNRTGSPWQNAGLWRGSL